MHYNAYDAGKNFRNVREFFVLKQMSGIFLLNFKFLAFKSLFRIPVEYLCEFFLPCCKKNLQMFEKFKFLKTFEFIFCFEPKNPIY